MNGTNRSANLRMALLSVAGTALVVFGSQSSTRSPHVQAISQEPEAKQANQDCDIDSSLTSLDGCPAETIIAQYKERYDLTVVLRGGVYWQVVSGQYVNDKYGYTIDLPDGIEALCTPLPMPWHGFFVDVANELKPPSDASENRGGFSWANWNAGVYVEACYNVLEYASADDAANASLGYYKKDHPVDLIILNHESTTLRRLPASRYLVQFLDARSGETMIAEEVVAIRAEEGIVYTIGLTTTAARYSQDEKVVRQILRGMRFTKPE
jgi:hypothetical protein